MCEQSVEKASGIQMHIICSLSLCMSSKIHTHTHWLKKEKKEAAVLVIGLIDKPVLDTLISPFLLPAGGKCREST